MSVGGAVLDVSKDRSDFMFLDYLTPKTKAPRSLKLWNLLLMGTPDVYTTNSSRTGLETMGGAEVGEILAPGNLDLSNYVK